VKLTRAHTELCTRAVCRAQRIPVTCYKSSASGPYVIEPAKIHPCFPFCPIANDQRYHVREMNGPLLQAGVLATQGIYWCSVHARMHACRPDCPFGQAIDNTGLVCPLSRQVVQRSLMSDFVEGVGTEDQVALAARGGRHPVHEKDWNVVRHDREARFPEEPRTGLFSDDVQQNTFRTGSGSHLDHYYGEAFAVIYHILFSDTRVQLERARCLEARDAVAHSGRAFIKSQARSGQPIFRDDLVQVIQREANRFACTPCLAMRPGDRTRCVAALAMQCIEFYIQLFTSSDVLAKSDDARLVEVAHAFRKHPLTYCVCVILGDFREDMNFGRTFIIEQNWVVHSMYPSSVVLEKLEYPMSTLSTVSKDMRTCLLVTIAHLNSPDELVTTSIPPALYLTGTDNMVDTFLKLRKERIMQYAVTHR
jgi:hypothetical protein